VAHVGKIFGTLSILVGIVIYGIWIEPYQVEITRVTIEHPQLARTLKGKTVVQISDLHTDSIGRREEKVLKILKEIDPDLIFLTGDYVKWSGGYEAALTFLSQLKAKMGIWAVMGDSDHTHSRKSCLFCHEPGSGNPTRRHSVRFLRNSWEEVEIGDGVLRIIGLEHEREWKENTKETIEQLLLPDSSAFNPAQKGASIVLSHSPMVFDSLDENHDILILSGDTHGGQIPLPSWLWNIVGYEKCARFGQGLFEKGRKRMFVSRGVGTSTFPVRIMRRPQVVVLSFVEPGTLADR
jgi:predicted MPP superfamily phosphohydrolase